MKLNQMLLHEIEEFQSLRNKVTTDGRSKRDMITRKMRGTVSNRIIVKVFRNTFFSTIAYILKFKRNLRA